MCAGNNNRSDLKALEEEGLVLLELDVKGARRFNLREPSSAYRALFMGCHERTAGRFDWKPSKRRRGRGACEEAVLSVVDSEGRCGGN